MTAKARTIEIIVAIILIVFAIYLSALPHTEDAEDIVIGLAEHVDNLALRTEDSVWKEGSETWS